MTTPDPSPKGRSPRRGPSRKKAPFDTPAEASIFLGWKGAPARRSSLGFLAHAVEEAMPHEALNYAGDGHLMTVAPTGAGKGVGVIIPNLLTYPGSVIAIDIKGELSQVTARRRREMGQKVVVLDPFHQVSDGEHVDALNPFDLFSLPGADIESDAEMLSAQFGADHSFSTDRYWDDTGRGLTTGLIAHIASTSPPEERNPNTLRKYLYLDELDYNIATWLDKGEVVNPLARDEFIAYLSAPSDKTRPCIRTTACTYMKCLGSAGVARRLENSTFDLNELMDGKPVTVYLVIPPEKLESHRTVLRAWLAALLTAVLRRTKIPELRTLFLVDEAAQLGNMPLLKTAITLLRGYGLQCWTFWQDLGQLRQLYPNDWTTMVTNAAALQVFGMPRHGNSRTAWQEVLGDDARGLTEMPAGEMAVSFADTGIDRHRRANYLFDAEFEGLFDANKRFDGVKLPGRGL
jgi:type IV secretion system protein VirD4